MTDDQTPQPAGEHHTGALNLTGHGNPEPEQLPNEIDPRAVEAAAKAHIERAGWDWNDLSNDHLDHEASKEVLLADMRVALRAAYPAIRQHVAEQIAAKANQIGQEFQDTAIVHRDLSHEHGRSTIKGTSHMTTAHAYRNKADGAWAVAHAAREIGGGQ